MRSRDPFRVKPETSYRTASNRRRRGDRENGYDWLQLWAPPRPSSWRWPSGIPALVHGARTGPTGSFTENAAAPPAAGTHLLPERSALGAVPAPTKGAGGAKAVRPATGASIAAQAPPGASTARPGPASTVPLVGAVSPHTGTREWWQLGGREGCGSRQCHGGVLRERGRDDVDRCVTGGVEGVGTGSRCGDC